MFFNVLLDLLLANGSDTGTEVATRPQMLSPVAFLQVGILVLQFARGGSSEILGNFGWTQLWRTRHQQVNMIDRHVPLHNVDVSTHTYLPNDFAGSFGNFCPQ